MTGHRVTVDAAGVQLHRPAQPGLHTVHMDGGAAVFGLDQLCQPHSVQHRAGLVVHLHGRYQSGFGGDGFGQGLHRHMAFGVGHHPAHPPAVFLQPFHHIVHRGMLVAGADDVIGPGPAGSRLAQNGDVVALTAAGGEIYLPCSAAQGRGHGGPGPAQQQLAVQPGAVERGGVGKVLGHHPGDLGGHRRRHPGGGGIVQIMHGIFSLFRPVDSVGPALLQTV